MVSAILNAALVMMGVFVFLAFLVLSFFRIIAYFGFYLLRNRRTL